MPPISSGCFPNIEKCGEIGFLLAGVIVCNGGKEFMNSTWDEWLAHTGIVRECTSKATPEQNAHVERFNQTVMCRARATLLQSNLPSAYLPYAIDMAIAKYNITPASRHPISPHFSMFGKQPLEIGGTRSDNVKVR